MFSKFSLYIALLCFSLTKLTSADYCKLTCAISGEKSSGCDCSGKKECKEIPVTAANRVFITKMHNEHREKVAAGKTGKKGLKGATNMMMLTYDPQLEFVASCWAKKCKSGHDMCRSTRKFASPGQNMYTQSGGIPCDNEKIFAEAIKSWYSEVKDVEPGCIQSSGSCDKVIGHFSQLAWAETTHVGCARVQAKDKTCTIFCNYGPGGNVLEQPVFKMGKPASQCPDKDVNKVYKSLCGNEEVSAARSGGERVVVVIRREMVFFISIILFVLLL